MRSIPQEATRPVQDTLPVLNPHGDSGAADPAALRIPPMDVAGLTDVGRQRAVNEDQFLIADLDRLIRVQETSVPTKGQARLSARQGTLLIVADGIGGHGHGDIASAVSLDTLVGYVLRVMPWFSIVDGRHDAEMMAALRGSVDRLQGRVVEVATLKGMTGPRMGSTLTAAYVDWPALLVVHVGDCRCYRMRQGTLRKLTAEHTIGAEMRTRGANEAVAAQYDNVLTRAVGADDASPLAEVHRHRLETGDSVLLCSDGLTAHVTDAEIAAVLARTQSSRGACGELVTLANSRGGTDNVTVLILRC